jgi:hypothetical protein
VYSKSSPSPDLYCIEIQRHPKDLGVSVVLLANCELMARREALRLFPEYKRDFAMMRVFLVKYVECDWQTGRWIVAKQDMPPYIPACIAAKPKPERKKLPRLEEEGDAQ